MINKQIFILMSLCVMLLTACSTDSSATTDGSILSDECSAGLSLGTSEAGLNVTTLCIDIKQGESAVSTQTFAVEIAATEEEQARGLMDRTELADDKGMIFPYQSPRILSFWMKNTVISLDIIFIKEDGRIANIARDTIPYSLDSVTSIAPSIAVLEVRAGLTKELGIKAGDIIRWE